MTKPSGEHNDPDLKKMLCDVVEKMPDTEKQNVLDWIKSIRIHPRKLCIVPVQYRDSEGRRGHNYTLDISAGGCFIETGEPGNFGSELLISLSFPGRAEPFRVKGKIAWRGRNGFGVQFEELSEEQQSELNYFVETL